MDKKRDLIPVVPLTPDEAKILLPDAPKPFQKDIHLFDTHIAGTSYIDDIEDLVCDLKKNDELYLFREVKNIFDERAIKIVTKNKEKIGYVPKVDNIIFSRLMDAGKMLFAKVEKIKKMGYYYRIDIKIYMRE